MPIDEGLDIGLEANDEAEGDKEPTGATEDEPIIDFDDVELLKGIIKAPALTQPSSVPKSGDKWGSSHLDGSSASSDSSVEDLDAKDVPVKKKVSMSSKSLHPNQ